MKIAVIGGTGFVGRHLCLYLARQDYQVVSAARHPVPELFSNENIDFRRLDLLAPDACRIDLEGVDCVVYLAARTSVMEDTVSDPLEEYRKLNLEAALNVAESGASQGIRRFIYLSSVKVNGSESETPFRETDTPVPVEDYAISKYEAEQALTEFAGKAGLELVILRPPLVYGPGAVGNFARLREAVERGRWLPLGAVENRRSYIAIDNLVQVIEQCIRHPRAAGQQFLVSDGEDVSVGRFIELLGEALGKPVYLLRVPVWILRLAGTLLGKTEYVNRLCGSLQLDISKIRRELDWEPEVTMRQGLRNLKG